MSIVGELAGVRSVAVAVGVSAMFKKKVIWGGVISVPSKVLAENEHTLNEFLLMGNTTFCKICLRIG